MRLVSQDGMIDVPYEYGSLSIAGGKCENFENAVIMYRNVSSPNGTKLAEYKSKEKALKAMEMVREKSFWNKDVFQFPKDEEVEI